MMTTMNKGYTDGSDRLAKTNNHNAPNRYSKVCLEENNICGIYV